MELPPVLPATSDLRPARPPARVLARVLLLAALVFLPATSGAASPGAAPSSSSPPVAAADAEMPSAPAADPGAAAAPPAVPTEPATPAASEPAPENGKPRPLAERHQVWLEEIAVLISKQERATFIALREDYQRDAFIERFWRTRDPYPDTPRNERRERWDALVSEAKSRFGTLDDERSKILLLNGPPAGWVVSKCRLVWPLELWFFNHSDQMPGEFWVVFYQRWGSGKWRIWEPIEGIDALADFLPPGTTPGQFLQQIATSCRDGDVIAGALAGIYNRGALDYATMLSRIQETPAPPGGEWASSFAALTTDIPADALPLDLRIETGYPSRYQARTVLQVVVGVGTGSAGKASLSGVESYNFLLTGEVILGNKLFESFRYKFDFPAEQVAGDRIPLVFERYLRPGPYRLVVKVEDTNGQRFGRQVLDLEVPQVEGAPPAPTDPLTAALLAEANAAIDTGDTTLQLIRPRGEMLVGMTRFDTLTTGTDIAEVAFYLDDREVLRKARPPYSVELDLGSIPRSHELRAVAVDPSGRQVAQDSLLVNSGSHRFAIELVEPEPKKRYERSLRARAEVQVPEGQQLERVELWFNETLLATLYGEPFVQPIVLPEGEGLGYVRAVAFLADGNSTEDVVFVNAPDVLEEVDVQMVEVFATVLDGNGRPVDKLEADDFVVREDGVVQTVRRFERVEDLPIHVVAMIDVSASMEESLGEVQQAAVSFFEEIIEPRDRGAVVTFNDHPNLAVRFTNDRRALVGGLAGLKAERGTSLWDSLVFTLFYFNGIKGQRAIVLLSDGKDEGSRFAFEQALDFAQRAGVAVYTIGLDIPLKQLEARRQLAKIAEQTGGRSFLVERAEELPPLYREIEHELRSRYLLAYQSTSTAPRSQFRTIDVEVTTRGFEARAMRGYYP
jgi:VWFA-related protein